VTSGGKKRVLVLGASGMLGNTVLRFFTQKGMYETTGSVRSAKVLSLFPADLRDKLIANIDVQDADSLNRLFALAKPDVVINCVGVVKQLAEADDPLTAIPINSILPHRLARLSEVAGARFIHLSTDCVFSGKKGMYREEDFADCEDLYGRSKYLGEVDYPNSITLRTSIIGHELDSSQGLLNWFLAQDGQVNGFTRAIFSGLPTVEIARVFHDIVIPNPELSGLYHLSSEPIAKFDLLRLIADTYRKTIEIRPDDKVVIDRSLDSSRFRKITGYTPSPWPDLVRSMHQFG
jgi:dTDP-4-dehydrorhamnose reductase